MTPEYSNLRSPRFAPGSRPPNAPAVDVLLWLLWLIAWALAAAVVLVGFGFLVGVVVMPALGAGTPLLLFLLLALLASLFAAVRRRRAGTVIAYLEQATRLNLPLPAMLRAAERSERGQTARALRRVRMELEAGVSVRDALALGLRGIPPRTLGLIGSAERSGQLPAALSRLSRDAVVRFDGRPGPDIFLRWYPATLALMIGAVITCVYVFVLPKFFAIFQDFSIPLPRITVLLAQTWDIVSIPLAIVVALATLIYVGRMLATIIVPSFVPRGPVRWITDQLAWHLPVSAGVARSRGLADVCHVMADALEAGHPLDYAVTEASRSGTSVVLAERMADWADQSRAGLPAAEGARRAKLPSMLVGLLRTAGGADLADVFRFLARYYDSRFARSQVMLQAALVPTLSLTAGAVVGFIVLSLFLPLVQLIDHVSGQVMNF